jgi:hypothetical protein
MKETLVQSMKIEMRYNIFIEDFTGRDHLRETDMGGRIKLKHIFCEHSNEHCGSLRASKFLTS